MFYLVGLGLNEKQATLECIEALKSCDKVLIETYTNLIPESSIMALEGKIGKKISRLKRMQVEDESRLMLEGTRSNNIALCVPGNPLIATTHVQLLLEAKKLGVKFKVIQGISVQNYLPLSGLDAYKFGRIVTIVAEDKSHAYAPESFYDFIEKNKSLGLHTLCLLDIRSEEKEYMTVCEALKLLEKIEEKHGKRIIAESVLLGIAGLGSENALIRAGSLEEMKNFPELPLPQCLVVCGQLSEKEREALKALSGLK